MLLSREEVIHQCCEIVGLAYHSIGDLSEPGDCFCNIRSDFQHHPQTLSFVREAVLEKLKREGVKIDPRFDEITGRFKNGLVTSQRPEGLSPATDNVQASESLLGFCENES